MMLLRSQTIGIASRRASTLGEKVRIAGTGDMVDNHFSTTKAKARVTSEVDENGESFRELFVVPKRKLRGQQQIEQATGRTAVVHRSRPDINDRLAVRQPRSKEIDPEQDWKAVWPAARTFNASVVPLPIRMGSRPDPEKRAPFKKEGNLELVKIPNFLHLTPSAIESHCNAIKKFCTKFPEGLKSEDVMNKEYPTIISYNTYIHQGTSIRDNRARVVTMTLNIDNLKLNDHAKEKLIRMAGSRYDPNTNQVTIITDRCHTRKQNLDYANYLLTVLYHEAQKKEAWEELQERVDNMKVEFNGSKCRDELLNMITKSTNNDDQRPEMEGAKDTDRLREVDQFGQLWEQYRNTEETTESTREYARRIKALLDIKSPLQKSL